MTYSPGSPGGSGYPPGSYGSPASSYAQAADPGPSKLPQYLNIAVVLFGLAAYVAAFGPVFTTSATLGPFSVEAVSTGGILLTLAAVLAALLAAIGLLPKTKSHPTLVALLAVLGVLAVVEQLVNRPPAAAIGWALWVVLAVVILQAIAAVLVLLYDTGVLTPPAPKPRYEQQHYGQYGQYGQFGGPGGYYSQPPSAPAGPPPGPRPAYPSQYGGYGQGPSAGGYGALAPQGPPTPPTGYPSFSPPPAVGSGAHHAATNPNLGTVQQPAAESSGEQLSGPPSGSSSGSSGNTSSGS